MANRDSKQPKTKSGPKRKRTVGTLGVAGVRDDTLDADLERERLEPGQNTDGAGSAGADPAKPHEDSNSNT